MRRAHKPAPRRSEEHRLGDRCLDRLRISSCCLRRRTRRPQTDTARTQESGKSSDDMDEKDDEIAHLSILARTANPRNGVAISNSP